MILDYKDMILARLHPPAQQEPQHDHDKYRLLVEALGEVVTDYVDKKNDKKDLYY